MFVVHSLLFGFFLHRTFLPTVLQLQRPTGSSLFTDPVLRLWRQARRNETGFLASTSHITEDRRRYGSLNFSARCSMMLDSWTKHLRHGLILLHGGSEDVTCLHKTMQLHRISLHHCVPRRTDAAAVLFLHQSFQW